MLVFAVSLLSAAVNLVRAEQPSAVAGATNATATVKLSDDQLGDLLQQATRLARVGLYDEAETRCRQILEQKPDQPTVKQLLLEIQEKRSPITRRSPGAELTRTLGNLIIPELIVREANPADVIERLRDESRKLTGGKGEINFVWQVPPGRALSKVTLNLKNVPMLDVIRYVTTLARLDYRVDSRAVVIFLAEPESGAPAGSNVKPQ